MYDFTLAFSISSKINKYAKVTKIIAPKHETKNLCITGSMLRMKFNIRQKNKYMNENL